MNYKEYLFDHGMSNPEVSIAEGTAAAEGESIAKTLGVRFIGYWDEISKFLFNDDNETGTSFAAKDLDEARQKLKQKRKEFLAYA